MGYPTKVQLIKQVHHEQWLVNFPVAVARAMELIKGETFEWTIEDRNTLILRRVNPPAPTAPLTGHAVKKKRPRSTPS